MCATAQPCPQQLRGNSFYLIDRLAVWTQHVCYSPPCPWELCCSAYYLTHALAVWTQHVCYSPPCPWELCCSVHYLTHALAVWTQYVCSTPCSSYYLIHTQAWAKELKASAYFFLRKKFNQNSVSCLHMWFLYYLYILIKIGTYLHISYMVISVQGCFYGWPKPELFSPK